jgi:hypothetical protein
MWRICRRLVEFWVVASALTVCMPSDMIALAQSPADELLFLGKPGPNAISLQISVGDGRKNSFRFGEAMALHFTASRRCYVIALSLSAGGDAKIIMPPGESPDNRILPGKEYTLFGPHSPVKLTADEGLRGAKIIVYACSKPLNLDPLKIPAGERMIGILRSSTEQMRILREKIENLSRDDGFSCEILFVKPEGDAALSLVSVGLPEKIKTMVPPKSVKPGGVTGGQGLSTGIEKPDQR